jgi:hypothetical protein
MTRRLMKLLLPAILFVGSLGNAQAAVETYTCDVIMAGTAANGTTFIRLTHLATNRAFTNKWFSAPTTQSREMLAIALAALTAGKQVQIGADIAVAGQPRINFLYMKK